MSIDVGDMLANGDTAEAIQVAYLQLTLEQIGLAANCALAYPRRGRPPAKPAWRGASAKSSRAIRVDDLPAAS